MARNSIPSPCALNDDLGFLIFEVTETASSQQTALIAKGSGPKLEGQRDLETYRRQVAAARAGLVDCPWDTTAAGMLALREGEAK